MIYLTHWSRVMHICVSKQTIIGSDNGLSPSRHQAIIWTNAGILLIQTSGTNFSEIVSEIPTFSFKKNASENVICKTAAILSRHECVNKCSKCVSSRHKRFLQIVLNFNITHIPSGNIFSFLNWYVLRNTHVLSMFMSSFLLLPWEALLVCVISQGESEHCTSRDLVMQTDEQMPVHSRIRGNSFKSSSSKVCLLDGVS